MRVEGMLYASEGMTAKILSDNALAQVCNVAHLPGIVDRSLAMPDIHWGYGFPIGGVAAFDMDEGVISPGGVGYDINCGVRVLTTPLHRRDVEARPKDVVKAVFREIPAGLGSKKKRKSERVGKGELFRILREGARWATDKGFGTEEDLQRIEDRGCIPGADPAALSDRALERGAPQVGTLGSGNHFVEVGYVDEIYDAETARAFGLRRDGVAVSIHSGSRGLGHQVCDDAIRVMLKAATKYGIDLPDRQLCAAPLSSGEGRQYLAAMACAANFAFTNRQVMSAQLEKALRSVFGRDVRVTLVYDVCHNIAKIEQHDTEDGRRTVCVHRKGATRAFPPGHADLPPVYRSVGQPVLIPGDMGRYSYVLAGRPGAMEQTFGSCCHGAGREMSRHKAKKAARGRDLHGELRKAGVVVMAQGRSTLAEEMPRAYKDVSEVVEVVHGAGLAVKVARLRPLCVVKG
jgi:tRNA-splicing ligase RtcB